MTAGKKVVMTVVSLVARSVVWSAGRTVGQMAGRWVRPTVAGMAAQKVESMAVLSDGYLVDWTVD